MSNPNIDLSKPSQKKPDSNSSKNPYLDGTLAYVLGILTGILIYITKPEDDFAKFHAIQSIGLGLTWVLVWFILIIIPIFGWMLLPFAQLAFIITYIFCAYQAYKGKKYLVPIVGQFIQDKAHDLKA